MKRLALAAMLILPAGVALAEPPEVQMILQAHKFSPDHLELAAGEKYVLVIKNLDATPEEFESADLNREKVVKGQGEIRVFIGPLDRGSYSFSGEYNPTTAQGVITVK